mgnify:CR=1 FL=1
MSETAAPHASDIQAGARANIGVVGLAVMGSNLARNLASREGNTVAIFNRSHEKTEHLVATHPEAGFAPSTSYAEFAASLQRPRTAIIMVKAGAPTDAVIDSLAELVACRLEQVGKGLECPIVVVNDGHDEAGGFGHVIAASGARARCSTARPFERDRRTSPPPSSA